MKKNLKDLEISLIDKIDNQIELFEIERMRTLEEKSEDHQAFYNIKDFITKWGYTQTVEDALNGYK